jgi:hypothetical protein
MLRYLVVVADADAATSGTLQELHAGVRAAFPNKLVHADRDSTAFHLEVTSSNDLRMALAKALGEVRSRVMRVTENTRRAGTTVSSKPSISVEGTQPS